MFDDIIKTNKQQEKRQKATYRQKCENCHHHSYILSNYPDKILCQKLRRHRDPSFWCQHWKRQENT